MPDVTFAARWGMHVLPEAELSALLTMLREAGPERENPEAHAAAQIIEQRAAEEKVVLSDEQWRGAVWAIEKAWPADSATETLPPGIEDLRDFIVEDLGYGDANAPSV